MGTRVVILCGGRGTRAYPHTVELPKPLLEVAGRPILGHVMEIYRRQGDFQFVLAAGYKAELVEDFACHLDPSYRVTVVDSGLEANTAERVWACRDHLDGTFMVTYGDGLGNVDVRALAEFHGSHPGAGTVTTVPLPSQYGTVDTESDGMIVRFREKPVLRDHWINGGFFVFDPEVFDHWSGKDLEKEVLPSLARSEQLYAYRHDGFWKSMDTYKDGLDLTALAATGSTPPWFEGLPAAASTPRVSTLRP